MSTKENNVTTRILDAVITVKRRLATSASPQTTLVWLAVVTELSMMENNAMVLWVVDPTVSLLMTPMSVSPTTPAVPSAETEFLMMQKCVTTN